MSMEDIAQAVELAEWSRVNAPRSILPTLTKDDPRYGPEFCKEEDCGDVMPVSRRELGRQRCTACEQRREDKIKRYA
jgi:hypothetical protein